MAIILKYMLLSVHNKDVHAWQWYPDDAYIYSAYIAIYSYYNILLCRGVARLINWLSTARPLTALIECLTVIILENIDLFQFLLVGHSQLLVGPGPYQAHPWLRLCCYVASYICNYQETPDTL